MAYEALARKWRPKCFEEVVGQGHVTRALANAISLGKIHHAYLFAGTRGVGKTTFARILARALNCEKGPTASPCQECAACREILVGTAVDVQEIDGASNTGIDDVRRLRENAAYAPARLRYKIYIIDEVHMLSKSAFNGLLKILEEPPPHTVFVFATTEPGKIPDTVLSRLQRFDFRMLSEEEILDRLREMSKAEEISSEEDALRLMARYAFGSMRDGQSIFEQAAVSGSGRITASLVEEMLGLVGTEAAIDLVGAVAAGSAGEAIRKFSALLSRGADMKFLYFSVVDVLRDIAVWKFTENDDLLYRHSPSSLGRVKELCGGKSREEWMFMLDIAFRSEKDVLGTEFPRLGFELLLLRLVNAPGLLDVEGLGEEASPETAPRPAAVHAARGTDPPPKAAATTFATRSASPPAPRKDDGLWDALMKNINAKKKTVLYSLLSQMKGRRDGDEIVISSPHQFVLDRLREEDKWPVLLQAVSEVAGKKLEVRLSVSAEKKSPDAGAVAGAEDKVRRKALSDPLLAEVLRVFDGATVVEVRPAPGKKIPPEAAEPEADAEDPAPSEPEQDA